MIWIIGCVLLTAGMALLIFAAVNTVRGTALRWTVGPAVVAALLFRAADILFELELGRH